MRLRASAPRLHTHTHFDLTPSMACIARCTAPLALRAKSPTDPKSSTHILCTDNPSYGSGVWSDNVSRASNASLAAHIASELETFFDSEDCVADALTDASSSVDDASITGRAPECQFSRHGHESSNGDDAELMALLAKGLGHAPRNSAGSATRKEALHPILACPRRSPQHTPRSVSNHMPAYL